MNNFYTFHLESDSEKKCPQWINSMNLFMNQLLEVQLTEPESKEEKEVETEKTSKETTMVFWDCMATLQLKEEETTDEIQISIVNITMRSQGPIMDES